MHQPDPVSLWNKNYLYIYNYYTDCCLFTHAELPLTMQYTLLYHHHPPEAEMIAWLTAAIYLHWRYVGEEKSEKAHFTASSHIIIIGPFIAPQPPELVNAGIPLIWNHLERIF